MPGDNADILQPTHLSSPPFFNVTLMLKFNLARITAIFISCALCFFAATETFCPWLSGHRHSLNIKELQTKYKLISGRKLSYIGVERQASGAGYEN
ncbi:MAG TPA: hypothetical protein VJL09_02425 [Candidatus Paceibacterota bacterium]